MKILVAGIGSIGRRHVHNLLSLGYKDILLYRTGKHTIEDDEKIKNLKTFCDLNKALALNPDVAFITNPTSLHVSVAIKCAQKGCDLFMEKPISNSLQGLNQLIKIVKSKKLVTLMGCQFRFHPLIQKIKEMITEKKLGRVVYARAEMSEYLPDWHPWENYKIGYSARKDLGGGVVLTQIHPIDYLYWFFGKVEEVKSIYASASDLQLEVEDVAEIVLKFENGVIGNVHVDYIQKPRVHQAMILGLRGRISWDCHAKNMVIADRGGKEKIINDPKDFDRNTMFIEEVKHFLDCVDNRKPTINPVEQGIDVLKAALKAKN